MILSGAWLNLYLPQVAIATAPYLYQVFKNNFVYFYIHLNDLYNEREKILQPWQFPRALFKFRIFLAIKAPSYIFIFILIIPIFFYIYREISWRKENQWRSIEYVDYQLVLSTNIKRFNVSFSYLQVFKKDEKGFERKYSLQ